MTHLDNLTEGQKAWPQRQFVDKCGRLVWPAIAIFLYSTVQIIRLGGKDNHYLFMIIGSILSILGAMAYIFASFTHGATGKKSFLGAFLSFLGIIPWAFGSYVVFYQGFWGFRELSIGFSIWIIVKSVLAIILGYSLVYYMYKIILIARSVKPNPEQSIPEERVDNLMASHSSFDTAVPIDSAEQQQEFINRFGSGKILSFVKREKMDFKGKNYEVIHFKNKSTNQERTLYFDVSSFNEG